MVHTLSPPASGNLGSNWDCFRLMSSRATRIQHHHVRSSVDSFPNSCPVTKAGKGPRNGASSSRGLGQLWLTEMRGDVRFRNTASIARLFAPEEVTGSQL